jgi:hypothetical protein
MAGSGVGQPRPTKPSLKMEGMIIDNIEELIRLDKQIDTDEEQSEERLRSAHHARWEFGKLMLQARVEGGRGRGQGSKLPVGYLDELAERTGKGRSDLEQRMWFAQRCQAEDELLTAVSNSDGTCKPWGEVRRGLKPPPAPVIETQPKPMDEPPSVTPPPKPPPAPLSNQEERKPTRKRRPQRKPPAPNPRREELVELSKQGKTDAEIERETGVPSNTVRREIERSNIEEKARAEGREEATVIDVNTAPLKVKERDQILRRQIRKELEDEFEPRIQAEVQKRVTTSRREIERLQADARRVLDGRKGIITRGDYDLIRSCLHPDSRLSVSDEKLGQAFRVFNEAEILFLNENDYPTSRLPSLEELRKRRGR